MHVPYHQTHLSGTSASWLGGIDLRAELEELFGGSFRDPPISRFGIARLAKLNDANKPVKCTCLGNVDMSADPTCSRCRGEGHLWKEFWIRYYKVMVSGRDALSLKKRHGEFGLIEVPFVLFYFTYDTVKPIRQLKRFDRIIEVETDLEGNVVTPVNRAEFWNINMVQEFAHRRIEHWRVACRNESLWTDADSQT